MAKVMQQNNNALDCVAAIFCKVMRVIANVHVIFFTKVLLDCTRFDDVVTIPALLHDVFAQFLFASLFNSGSPCCAM